MDTTGRAVARALPWALRAVWAAQALVAGPAFAGVLHDRSRPVQLSASTGLWAVWGIGLLASLLPLPVSLTVLRSVAGLGVVAVVAAGVGGGASGVELTLAAAIVVVAAGLAFSPDIGTAFVNGPAYGDERRFLLRVPAPLLLGPVPLSWAGATVAPAAGVLLLASRSWIPGVLLLIVGGAFGWYGGRSMHVLTQRWVVFVPAGVVLKDALVLAEPVLFRSKQVDTLRAAPADTDSLDLTQHALGLALELVLTEKVEMVLLKPLERATEEGSSARLLFTPSRPGQVIRAAATKGLRTT